MNSLYWVIGLFIFLFVSNVVFYRIKGAELLQFPRQFPLVGVQIDDPFPDDIKNVKRRMLSITKGQVEAWLLSDEKKRPVIIVAHGNKGYIDSNLQFSKSLKELGYHVLLVEYPGYGRSGGRPSEDSLTEAFTAGYDWMESEANVSHIIAYGNSLGTGVIANLSEVRRIDCIILKSSFSSFASLISKQALIPKMFIINPFNTADSLAKFAKPILLLHGKNDTVAKVENAIEIKNNTMYSEMLLYPGGHDSPSEKETLKQINIFIMKYIKENTR